MTDRRRLVLLALLAVVAIVAALLLRRVLATVFFAVTVAYVLVPLYRWLRRRGLPRWWASAVSTFVAFGAAVALLLPIGAVLYLRRGQLVAFLRSLPETVVIDVAGFVYSVDTGEATALLTSYLTRLAIGIVGATPELVAHATVFAFVVFGLLLGRPQVRRAFLRPVPDEYHDVAQSFHDRTRETLFALYVIQAATALGTFVIAFGVFWLLGYPYPVTLAVIAGILQFLPVVGPSLLVIAIGAYEFSVGTYADGLLVLALGLVLVGFLPDAVIRPRLARETAGLPSSLYFVGFVGGLLSLGPVGIIAGPLVLALLVESLSLLAREDGDGAAEPGAADEVEPDPPRDFDRQPDLAGRRDAGAPHDRQPDPSPDSSTE